MPIDQATLPPRKKSQLRAVFGYFFVGFCIIGTYYAKVFVTAPSPMVLTGHVSYVKALSFSKDGKTLVSGGVGWGENKGEIIFWEAQTGKIRRRFNAGNVYSIALSTNGKILVSASKVYGYGMKTIGSKIGYWDAQTGRSLHNWFLHSSLATTISFLDNKNALIIGEKDSMIGTWKVPPWKFQRLPISSGSFTNIVLSPNGKLLSAIRGSEILVWECQTGKLLHTLLGHTEIVSCVAFSADSKLLVSGSFDETVRLWNLKSGLQTLRLTNTQSGAVSSVAISPDGKLLASGHMNRAVNLWDIQKKSNVTTFNTGWRRGGWIRALAFSPNGKVLASGAGTHVELWPIQ